MSNYERNLVLVHTPGRQARSDFETIQAKLADHAPDIEVFITENGQPLANARELAERPTLVFSPIALKNIVPLRGRVYAGGRLSKFAEIKRMAAGGIRVPDSVMLEPTTRLDPATWGRFTVLKPNHGLRGAGVRLWRTRDVRWVDPFSWPRGDPRHGQPLIAQRFVDTGPLSQHYRVMTVLGRPVYSSVHRSVTPRSFDLALVDRFIDEPIAANSGEREIGLNFEEDVIAFAADVARVFPELPALGIDIIRQRATGRLYALEVNGSGYVWHFSSDHGLEHQRTHGLDYASQFGALDIIADALIEVTRGEAE